METNLINTTTMKPNTPIAIGGVKNNGSESGQFSTPKPRAEQPAVSSSEQKAEPKKIEINNNKVEKNQNNIVNFSNKLADQAKQKGVDEAWRILAGEEIKEERIEEKKTEVQEKQEVETFKRPHTVEKVPLNSEKSLAQQVEGLSRHVEELAKENAELKKQLSYAQEMSKQALMTAYELAQVLQKMIEDEEDEKKKKNLLEMLVKIMASILVAVLEGPDEAEKMIEEKKYDKLEKAAA